MATTLKKAGANWVDGDRFFNREAELQALRGRILDRTHTLLTAQRRMGKTSLVRELLRQLDDEGEVATLFVDLEDALTPADAIAEIAIEARALRKSWQSIASSFANTLQGVGDHVESIGFGAAGIGDLKVKLRSGIDSGSWQRRGDQVFAALAGNDKPVVLALDELPILVNRLLKGADYQITQERRQEVEIFLAWLRKNGQNHRSSICMIVSGSVGLEPILKQAGLTANVNIFSPYQLDPWSEAIASQCLAALARTYGIQISPQVRKEICALLGCCIPHHVQQFFDYLEGHLRKGGKTRASLNDVQKVYQHDMLGIQGQIALEHYEDRLRLVLGTEEYELALTLLAEAAVNNGLLAKHTIDRYRHAHKSSLLGTTSIDNVLYMLSHDGYFWVDEHGHRFVSHLVQDWWRARYAHSFISINDSKPSNA